MTTNKCVAKIIKKGAGDCGVSSAKGVFKMSKLFAVREELLNDKEQREKLKNYLEKEGKISTLTVVTRMQGKKLISEAPFLKGFTYDAVKVDNFSERKLATAVALLLIEEGEKSLLFASEAVLLRHLKKIS